MSDVVVTPQEVVIVENSEAIDVTVLKGQQAKYLEYYALFNWFTGAIEILNGDEDNFLPITWTTFPVSNIDYGGNIYTFTATHNYSINDVQVYFEMPNNQGTPLDIYNYGENTSLELSLYWESDVLIETRILIRVSKDAVGAFE